MILILTLQTKAAKPVLGKYYREPKKSGPFPSHLFENLVRSIKEDHYVDDSGEILYYQTDIELYKSSKSKSNWFFQRGVVSSCFRTLSHSELVELASNLWLETFQFISKIIVLCPLIFVTMDKGFDVMMKYKIVSYIWHTLLLRLYCAMILILECNTWNR